MRLCLLPALPRLKRHSDLAEPLYAQLAPIRELIVSIPAPLRDHGEHENSAFAEQLMVNIRIVLADFFRRMGEIEFDRSTTARLEVYEQRADSRAKDIAWVRLTV